MMANDGRAARRANLRQIADVKEAAEKIAFSVYGDLVAKARPRVGRRGLYNPKDLVHSDKTISWFARMATRNRRPIKTAVTETIAAYFTIPRSWSRARKAQAQRSLRVRRPDLDNVVKLVLDGCSGVVFLDDAQVARLSANKRFAARSRIEVVVAAVVGESPCPTLFPNREPDVGFDSLNQKQIKASSWGLTGLSRKSRLAADAQFF